MRITVNRAMLPGNSGSGVYSLNLPRSAEILKVDDVYGIPTLWWRGDVIELCFTRQIAIIRTDDEAPPVTEARYIGTFAQFGTHYHAFERIEP